MGWDVEEGFALEQFLARPLVARLATVGTSGPLVRPVWYLWEEGRFWWLTGPWSALARQLARDPRVALVVDSCVLATREVLQVIARGEAAIEPFDAERARRWGARYLGPDEAHWGRFRASVFEDEEAQFVTLAPETLSARDLSY